MTTPARAAAPAAPTAAATLPTGYVEVVAADRVLGWAWDPSRPDARLRVELRLDGAVLAEGLADRPRDDLAAGGIGDGAHAFSLPVDPAHRDRGAELSVLAHGADGAATLGNAAGTPAAGAAAGLARIERGLTALVGSQRLIHRNLQAVLMAVRGGAASPPADAAIAEAREELRQQVAALEIFVTRLDDRLARLAETPRAEGRGDGHGPLLALLGALAGAGLTAAALSLL